MTAEAVTSFSSTVGEFLIKSKSAGRTRFIIDLQRNDGGGELLAIDAFKQVSETLHDVRTSLIEPIVLSND